MNAPLGPAGVRCESGDTNSNFPTTETGRGEFNQGRVHCVQQHLNFFPSSSQQLSGFKEMKSIRTRDKSGGSRSLRGNGFHGYYYHRTMFHGSPSLKDKRDSRRITIIAR
jgi:hypothetical protein